MTPSGYCGVVLAAGGSTRFAGPVAKQLAEIDGEPAVRRAARRALASGLGRLVVVTGHAAEDVGRTVRDLDVETVYNPDWRNGQSASVRAGLAAVAEGAVAVVFVPCDQPYLTAELIDGLIGRHLLGAAPIVAPAWRGRRGAPVLIAAELFAELTAISGDTGARQLFGRHQVTEVAIESEEPLLDFDTEEELRALLARQPPTRRPL